MLFDIGIAGPIAGFVVAVPALFIGLAMSHVVRDPAELRRAVELGEPLLFKLASWLLWGTPPDGYSLEHASDGVRRLVRPARDGAQPVSDRTARRRPHLVRGARPASRRTSRSSMIGVAVVLAYFSASWIVWTVLMIVMLFVFGPRHPRGRSTKTCRSIATRVVLALVRARRCSSLCFTPAPIEPLDLAFGQISQMKLCESGTHDP